MNSQPFRLIYKQMLEMLDDQNESKYESYYLTAELYEYLKSNLNQMVNKSWLYIFVYKIIL